ncbi:MAG: hypothetical protein ACR2J1_02725 [Methyloceanibacter sp.]|uniref:hypothetical protein n=1 Tax=Methyloceanibacter sp. TaxID=1965321 RepID=UPI003D9AE8D0
MAHLVIIACLVAVQNECKEIPLLDITAEDVTLCITKSHENAEKWQKQNTEYVVIGTKCVKNS